MRKSKNFKISRVQSELINDAFCFCATPLKWVIKKVPLFQTNFISKVIKIDL